MLRVAEDVDPYKRLDIASRNFEYVLYNNNPRHTAGVRFYSVV